MTRSPDSRWRPWARSGGQEPHVDRRGKNRRPDRVHYRVTSQWEQRYARMLLFFDASSITLTSLATVLVSWKYQIGDLTSFVVLSIVMVPLWVTVISFSRGYETRFLGVGSEEFRRVGVALTSTIGVVAFVSYAISETKPRGYIQVALPIAAAVTLLGRCLGRTILYRLRAKGRCQHRVLVVGSGESAASLVELGRREPSVGWNIIGACLNRATGRRQTDRPEGSGPDLLGVPIVGTFDDIPDAIRSTRASAIAIAESSDLGGDMLRRLMWDLEGSSVHVLVASTLTDVTGPRISMQPVAGLPLLQVEEPELSGARRIVKSAFDRLIALALIILLAVPMTVIAVAIRLRSRGPAIFRQVRVGRKGRRFTMYKFRSMYVDAEARLEEVRSQSGQPGNLLFKIQKDPRVTPVGRFLRSWSLDELPQLFNALNGTMSLVGPRPPLPWEVDRYADDVHRRLMVKPGITGVWQVNGRSDLEWDESVRLDLRYVENWSLAMDLSIMWRTVFAVARRSGAY